MVGNSLTIYDIGDMHIHPFIKVPVRARFGLNNTYVSPQ